MHSGDNPKHAAVLNALAQADGAILYDGATDCWLHPDAVVVAQGAYVIRRRG